jgi:hypothetical protein
MVSPCGIGVAVGATGVGVGGARVGTGDTGVGGAAVAVGGTGVGVVNSEVAVDGRPGPQPFKARENANTRRSGTLTLFICTP